ncbi:MAG: alpha/beta hydrolase, partial [Devosia sp.]
HPRHRLNLYAPRRHSGKLPLLMFVYGGGWEAGSRAEYDFAGRAFAGLGYLTAVVDYRLVPEVVFPSFVEDVGAAAEWFIGHAGEYDGDAAGLTLAGHSAGAYNAMMVALQPERFGAPSLAGRVKAMVGLSGPYDFYPFDVKQSIDAFSAYPDPLRTQPINAVTAAAPPMLLVHGTADTTVGDYHTVRMSAKLRTLGVPVAERHYAKLVHPSTLLGLMLPLRHALPVWKDVKTYLSASASR